MSKRYDALKTIQTRLAGISVLNGFNTDAGALVFLGEVVVLGPNDPDQALAIVVGSDEPGYQGENVTGILPVEIQAIAKANAKDPSLTIEAMIADIKKAIEIDHNLGGITIPRGLERGQTRVLDRQEGSEDIGIGVGYRLTIVEQWGAP